MAGALLDRDASDRQQVVAGGSWSESSEANCEVIGPCLMCAEDELKVTFCQKTGRREEVGLVLRWEKKKKNYSSWQ